MKQKIDNPFGEPRPDPGQGVTQAALIGLGSNLGDRLSLLRQAVAAMLQWPGTSLDAISSLYETDPVGGPQGQGPFLNVVVKLQTHQTPEQLYTLMQACEAQLGRPPQPVRPYWGPRVIDLDLLLHGAHVWASERLTVPHPRLHERAFVLIPLCEVAADAVHPLQGTTIRQMLQGLAAQDMAGVRRIEGPSWFLQESRVCRLST